VTDYLKVFADAVFKRFNVDVEGATLKALATGGMFADEGPQKNSAPYIIYDLASDEPIRTFNVGGVAQLIEQPDITFRCYAITKAIVLNVVKELTAVYDDVSLTVTGFNMIRFDRGIANTFKDPDKKGFVATVAYSVMM
jgi:hypothetical protein